MSYDYQTTRMHIFLAYVCVINHTLRENSGACGNLLPVFRDIALESTHGCNTELSTERKCILMNLCYMTWNALTIATLCNLC